MKKSALQIWMSVRLQWVRWTGPMVFVAGMSSATLSAADIPVTTTNDSGAGSLRQGLASAVAGDRLVFDPLLNGTTLANGGSLLFDKSVTLLDASTIMVTDPHAFKLQAPLIVDWAGTLNLNGSLAGASGLTKAGLGTVVLSNANSYGGGTLFDGGTLRLQHNQALGTGLLDVTGNVGTTVLDLANGVNAANDIRLHTTNVLNVDAGATGTLSGLISETGGSFGFTKIGTGALVLSGANTFSGGVYVAFDSTIRAEHDTALGSGQVTVAGALTLDLANGLNVGNHIFLGNSFTANVDTGMAALSGVIDDTTATTGFGSRLTKTGAGTLILSGANTYTGGSTVSQGTLQGDSNSLHGDILNNGTVVFDQAGIGTYDGNISGTGNLFKTGANAVIFNGTHTYIGPTTIDVGELQVRGSMTSDVQVSNSFGVLSGSGTVGNVTNNGFVQPGDFGIGRLHVNGNFTQQAGGTTEIQINSSGNTAGVNNDHLDATGQATLDGTLNVIATGGGVFANGTQYTILNAAGGVSGHFAHVTDNLALFDIKLTYEPNDVLIELQRIANLHDAATTSNQLAVGTVLDNISTTGSMFDLTNTLGALTPAEQQRALNQLGGDLFGTTQTLGLQVGDQFQRAVNNRLINNGQFLTGNQPTAMASASNGVGDSLVRGQSPSSSPSGWVQGFGASGSLRSDGNAAGVNFNQGGVAYGVDLAGDDSGVIGITGGNSFVGFRQGYGGSGQLASHQVGLYMLKQIEQFYFLGSANYGYNNYNTTRQITVPSQTLQGNYVGHQFGAYAETGFKFDASYVHFQPLVGLQYLSLAQRGFDETGGSAALNVAGSQADSLRANLGGRIVIHSMTGPRGAVWTPYWQGRWVAELLNNDRIVNASFNGVPIGGTFTTHGNSLGQNYGVLSKGLNVQVTNNWSLFGNIDLMFGSRFNTHTGSGGILYVW